MRNLRRSGFFDYAKLLNSWAESFGPENIIVRPYEKSQFKGGELIHDFLSIFEINNFGNFVFEQKEVNPSLSRDQIILIKAFHNAGLEEYVDDVIRKPYNLNVSGSKYFLSPQERENLIYEFSESNSIVAREFLNRKDGKLFKDPMPSMQDKHWSDIQHPATEYLIKTFTHLLSEQSIRYSAEIAELKERIKSIES